MFDIELDPAEFQQSEWIPEEEDSRPLYTATASPAVVAPAPAPATAPALVPAAVPRERPTLTGPLCFPSGFVAEEPGPAGDPWAAASADPWSRQASVLNSAAESVTGSVSSLSAEFARQNAELIALRLDLFSVLRTISGEESGRLLSTR